MSKSNRHSLSIFRIFSQDFLEDGKTIFNIEFLDKTHRKRKKYSGSAAEIMNMPFFHLLSPHDITRIVHNFAEEEFIREKKEIARFKQSS